MTDKVEAMCNLKTRKRLPNEGQAGAEKALSCGSIIENQDLLGIDGETIATKKRTSLTALHLEVSN